MGLAPAVVAKLQERPSHVADVAIDEEGLVARRPLTFGIHGLSVGYRLGGTVLGYGPPKWR